MPESSAGPDDLVAATPRRFADDDTPTAVDDSEVEVAVFEGEAVIFHEPASMVHHLGAVAGAVWFCSDGSTTVAAMVAELAELFSTPPEDVEPMIHEALERFAAEGLLVGYESPHRIALTPDPVVADDGTEVLAAPPDP